MVRNRIRYGVQDSSKVLYITFMLAGILCCLGGIIGCAYSGLYDRWWYPANYESSLNLADDASLPQDKAKYLQEYRDRVATITGEPRYILKKPNLDTKMQLEVLDGLITRFRDIANLQPSDMAYQTGMQQLTGQEMDHQLKDISSIFYSAKIRESLLQFLIIRGVVPVSLFILGIICFITGSKVGDSN